MKTCCEGKPLIILKFIDAKHMWQAEAIVWCHLVNQTTERKMWLMVLKARFKPPRPGALFAASLHNLIDWSHGPEYVLDGYLQA